MALRFFIAPKKPGPQKTYQLFAPNGIPYTRDELPEVVLFGGMTQNYLASLIIAIYCHEGVRLKLPGVYAYPGFHSEEIRMPYKELIKHIVSMVGPIKGLPSGCVVSIDALFERIKQAAAQKNKSNRKR